jgi:aminomethyltransferase
MNPNQSPAKLTPVYDAARNIGANFVDIAGWQVPQVFSTVEEEITVARRSIALADGSASGKIVVEGQGAEAVLQAAWGIPSLATGQGIDGEAKHIYRLRDDQFFIHLDPGKKDEAIRTLTGGLEGSHELVTVTDITHGRADLLLIGPQCTELLSRLCSLDFHPSQFPDLCAKQSSLAKTRQLILRHDLKPPDGSPIPAFSLIGPRSLAAYLWQAILEAGRDLDLAFIGWLAFQRLHAGS